MPVALEGVSVIVVLSAVFCCLVEGKIYGFQDTSLASVPNLPFNQVKMCL